MSEIIRKYLPIGYSRVCPFAIEECLASQDKEICESFCLDAHNLCGNFLEGKPVSNKNFCSDFESYEICTKVINGKKRLIIAQIQDSVEYGEVVV